MPTGNPGILNPRKRPKYRDIPEADRCRVKLSRGNFYRWAGRCHRRATHGGELCDHHRGMLAEGIQLDMVTT